MIRVALIGCGSIACVIARTLAERYPEVELAGAIDADAERARERVGGRLAVTTSLEELIGWAPDFVVECAGHAGLKQHSPAVLRQGIDMVVASVGALADATLEATLREAAAAGGAHIRIPSGAIGGLDALASARV